MAKLINPGYTDTAIAENPVLVRGKLNFTSDFRIGKTENGLVNLVNLTSPNDRTEKIVISFSDVKDIYNGSDVDPSAYAPSKRGINLYAQVRDTYAVTDDTDADFLQHLPVSCSITIRMPASEYLTAQQAQTILGRTVSSLFDQGSESTDRLNALLKGSLKPSEL